MLSWLLSRKADEGDDKLILLNGLESLDALEDTVPPVTARSMMPNEEGRKGRQTKRCGSSTVVQWYLETQKDSDERTR